MINSESAKALIKEWPEVFENIQINALPVMYLDKVIIKFITGMIWEVDVKNYLDTLEATTIQDLLEELISEYKDEIKDIKYTFDIELLKKDISTLSDKLL